MIIRSHQRIAAFTPSCYNMSIQTEQHKEDQGMKEIINVFDYAEQLNKVLPQGILLNTNGEKFNSMVIGWGHLGTLWGLPTYTVYVRQSRYTKPQLDQTKEFTISAPVSGQLSKEVFRVCGGQSGRDLDKEKAANLTLVEAEKIHTPGIKEYPLTLECKILYQQDQVLDCIPEDIRRRYYSNGTDAGDFHTAYVGQIVSAYVIKED